MTLFIAIPPVTDTMKVFVKLTDGDNLCVTY